MNDVDYYKQKITINIGDGISSNIVNATRLG